MRGTFDNEVGPLGHPKCRHRSTGDDADDADLQKVEIA
jgi:hypothetical protein